MIVQDTRLGVIGGNGNNEIIIIPTTPIKARGTQCFYDVCKGTVHHSCVLKMKVGNAILIWQ